MQSWWWWKIILIASFSDGGGGGRGGSSNGDNGREILANGGDMCGDMVFVQVKVVGVMGCRRRVCWSIDRQDRKGGILGNLGGKKGGIAVMLVGVEILW